MYFGQRVQFVLLYLVAVGTGSSKQSAVGTLLIVMLPVVAKPRIEM